MLVISVRVLAALAFASRTGHATMYHLAAHHFHAATAEFSAESQQRKDNHVVKPF